VAAVVDRNGEEANCWKQPDNEATALLYEIIMVLWSFPGYQINVFSMSYVSIQQA
jgi:hypothetical protein